MRYKYQAYLFAILVILMGGYVYMVSCTHKDSLVASNGPQIQRGTQVLNYPTDSKVSFDKQHSNVGWETAYLGGLSLLTGRFDTMGITTLNFDEANPANTSFEAWVWVNKVNTSEPRRDQGCLQTTFGTTTSMTTDVANVAIVKSKKVEFSTTDNGYIVTFDFTFHGFTKELTGKFYYDGSLVTGSGTTAKNVYGFSFNFQFLAKTDFGIVSTSIADAVTVKCNTIFRQTQ
ncbi:MAG TPA: YceI family protein [Chitinophagaceae bacterium]|nr:YceI family protein [Chitinophagaceae bacterium]